MTLDEFNTQQAKIKKKKDDTAKAVIKKEAPKKQLSEKPVAAKTLPVQRNTDDKPLLNRRAAAAGMLDRTGRPG